MSQKIYLPNTSEKPPRHIDTATTPTAYTKGKPASTTHPRPESNAIPHSTNKPILLIPYSFLHQAPDGASSPQTASSARNGYLAQLEGQTVLVPFSVLKAESSQALFQNRRPIQRTHLHRQTQSHTRSSCYLA